MSQMKSALIARKGILSGSTAIQKMNASSLELSRLWFRKCVCVCVWREVLRFGGILFCL